MSDGYDQFWESLPMASTHDSMAAALEADGEKLRQMTGEDHGPFGTVSAVEREIERLCNEGKMTTSHADEVASRIFSAAHGI